MKRNFEKNTLSEFQKFLSQLLPQSSFIWEDVPQEKEPPDWYLTIDGKLYAVEATTIVVDLEISPNMKIPEPKVTNTLVRFVKEVEDQAKYRKILKGCYLIALSPIANLSEHHDKLMEELLNYIQKTKNEIQLEKHKPFSNNQISIQKVDCDNDRVGHMVFLGVKSDRDSQDELESKIHEALKSKTNKLKGISNPKILLLFDDFHYSHISDWLSAIANCDYKKNFECIVQIDPPNNNRILWTSNLNWKIG